MDDFTETPFCISFILAILQIDLRGGTPLHPQPTGAEFISLQSATYPVIDLERRPKGKNPVLRFGLQYTFRQTAIKATFGPHALVTQPKD